MNSINFIKTPPPEKQQAVYHWYRTTLYAFAVLCGILLGINGYQLYQLHSLGGSKKQLREATQNNAHVTERIAQLTALQEQLAKQSTKLNAPTTFNPADYVRAIASTIPDDTCLFTADISQKGNMQLTGYTESAESLRTFMQALGALPYFAKIELSSLQPENTQNNKLFKFTMTSQLQSV